MEVKLLIWCRDLTPGASQFVVEPPIASPTLVNRWYTFQRSSIFLLLGRTSADVLSTIMTNVPDDYMSLDGVKGASILLNNPGFLRQSIRFCRESHSHKARLWPHECRESPENEQDMYGARIILCSQVIRIFWIQYSVTGKLVLRCSAPK